MERSANKIDPFLVIRATVESDIGAPGILAISSAIAGDGKTAVAAGIGRSLAEAGYRTLVLDAATRGADPVGGEPQEPLSAEGARDRVAGAVRSTGSGCDYLSLDAVGSGVSSAVSIAALYEAVRERYQYTVVDTSVLNGTGLALSRGADGVVLAVREGRGIVSADGEAVQLLKRLKARFLGVIATTDRFGDSDGSSLIERLAHRAPVSSTALVVQPVTSVARQPVSWFQQFFAPFGRLRPSDATRLSTPE